MSSSSSLSFGVLRLLLLFSRPSANTAAGDRDDSDDRYRSDDGPCDYYQLIEPGNRSYYLYSPGYPDPYRADQPQDRAECRWFAKTTSPADRLSLDCHVFDLPESSFCQSDALVVSRVGDVNFSDGVKHCGSRPFTAVSRTNKMNIKFSAKRRSKGGRFTCSIGAKRMDPRTAETAAKSPQFCECGDQNKGPPVNGKTAGVNEFPLMASLIDGQTANLFCGATVIGRHYALTSARCLANVDPSQMALLVGDHDITALGSDADLSILVFVTEIYIHPLFDPSSVAHDLAIIETQDEIPFSSKVGPACMPFKHINNDFVGDIVKVLGWGTVNFADSTSGSLQKSYLKVAPMAQCMETYRNETERNQLCTYIAKVNYCQVDLGGPILWSDPATGRLNVIGVVSDRFVCAESTPSMHTRLATVNNMNWMKVVLTGKKSGQMVFLGVGYGSILYFRFQGQKDLYSWDTKLLLLEENVNMARKSRDCCITTHVDVDNEGKLWVLDSNIQDFIRDQTDCYGPSILLTAVQHVPVPMKIDK